MIGYSPRYTLALCVAVSLLAHAAGLAPFLLVHGRAPPHTSERLRLELFGLLAERQQAATGASAAVAAASRSHAAPAPPRPTAAVPPRPAPTAEARTESASVASDTAPTTAGEITLPAAGARPATTIDAEARELDALRRYLASLQRRLQAALVYPEAARRIGFEGTTRVRFVILPDGRLRPDTLAIAGSSGDDDLDAAALAAARAGEPFDPPPREMSVVVAVGFRARP